MVQTNKWQIMGIFFLSASVLLSGLFIGLSLNKKTETGPIMTIEQVSEYIGLSTDEISDILIWEDAHAEYFSNTIMKFPYYVIRNEKYFNTNDIELWLHNVSTRSVFNKFLSLNQGWGEK